MNRREALAAGVAACMSPLAVAMPTYPKPPITTTFVATFPWRAPCKMRVVFQETAQGKWHIISAENA